MKADVGTRVDQSGWQAKLIVTTDGRTEVWESRTGRDGEGQEEAVQALQRKAQAINAGGIGRERTLDEAGR